MALKFNPLELITRSLLKSPYFSSITDVPFNIKRMVTDAKKDTSEKESKRLKVA
jgi:hypothetical protein